MAMSGVAPIIEPKSRPLGDALTRRLLIAASARARLLRQRKQASLIERQLYQLTPEMLRHETRRQG